MKKSAKYLIGCLLLMFAAGCVREELQPEGGRINSDGTITFTVGVTIPDVHPLATRSIGDVPADPEQVGGYLEQLNLYIFVFEDTGSPESNYLRELVHGPKIKLLEGGVESDSDLHGGAAQLKFSATFDGTAEKAILHIVATADPKFEGQLYQIYDRSELGIMSGVSGLSTHDNEAYWTRVELEMPISGENVSAIQGKLSHLPMIRNFARIKVDVDSGDATHGFQLEGFEVVNIADRGYVAAYNEKAKDGKPGFMTDFEPAADGVATAGSYYGYLSRELNYMPARHPQSGRIHPDDNFEWINSAAWDLTPKYLFERPAQDNHKTFIVVKGHFAANPGNTRYIKLDIGSIDRSHVDDTDTDENGEAQPFGVFEPFDIVRNVSYEMTITKVASDINNIGHASAESAIVSPPSNNISASIETRKILNIYDGADYMQVNATTVVIVDTEGENGEPMPSPAEFVMKWRYYRDYDMTTKTGTLDNGTVRWYFPGYALGFEKNGSGEDPIGIIGSAEYLETIDDDNNGDKWRGFNLKFNTPDETVRQKTVRLYSPFGLTRDVTFVMRKRWEFVTDDKYPSNIEVYPGFYSHEDDTLPSDKLDEVRELIPGPGEVGSQRGAQLTVMFELPDDIPEALFPLDFTIGFDRQNAENAYEGNATVMWGKSMFEEEDVNVPRMQFVKTVNWLDYNGSGDPGDNGHKIVTARFLTTTDVLASNETDKTGGETSTTRVRVTNPYFILGQDSFFRSMTNSNVDPDPNRTLWSWYFGDPGWRAYLGGQTTLPDGSTHSHSADSEYDELWIKGGHTEVTRDGYAIQFAFPNAASLTSADNPEFKINFDAETNAMLAEGGYTIKLTLTGASLVYRTQGFLGANKTYYYRRPAAQAIVKDASGNSNNIAFPDFADFERSEPRQELATNATYNGLPTVVERTLTIEPGQKLETINIWSVAPAGTQTTGDNVATLWYGIRCEITPN